MQDLPLVLLIVTYGFAMFNLGRWWQWAKDLPKEEKTPCPHGHKDWDDCPVCCH